jgi:hypothetical protein
LQYSNFRWGWILPNSTLPCSIKSFWLMFVLLVILCISTVRTFGFSASLVLICVGRNADMMKVRCYEFWH